MLCTTQTRSPASTFPDTATYREASIGMYCSGMSKMRKRMLDFETLETQKAAPPVYNRPRSSLRIVEMEICRDVSPLL